MPKPIEGLFPFVLRARILLVGRESLYRSRSRLHFILVTADLSENSRKKILSDFADYPVVCRYRSEDLEKHFRVHGAKVIGFRKSTLAQSVYVGLKEYRVN